MGAASHPRDECVSMAKDDIQEPMRRISQYLASALFVIVGVLHFTHAATFVAIMPTYVPTWLHLPAVLVSGAAEIAGGIGLMIPRFQRAAGGGLLVLLAVVFPANIHMAVNRVGLPGMEVNEALLWARLPMQGVLALWIWWLSRETAERRDGAAHD